ncbi:MAG: hypothetical protein ACOYK1_00190 [Vampirovibrionia bacterium]
MMNGGADILDLDEVMEVILVNARERSEEPMNFWKKIGEDSSDKDILTSRYLEAKPH